MADQDTPPPTITAIRIPIIKKGEYDICNMRMRQYICHTDHNLWDIIVNRDLEDEATPSGEQSSPPVPKTAKQLAARRNQERIESILLLAIPNEYILKFHNVPDAKSLWAAIKSRFRVGGGGETLGGGDVGGVTPQKMRVAAEAVVVWMVMMWCCVPARVAATEDDDDDGIDEGGCGEVFISFKVGLHYLLAKVVSVGTAPGPNSSDHNVNTITNGDGMPRMRTFRETIFPE
ncbi:hypothetical protein Tco_0344882 [Tanacetum coccineum]